MKFAELQAGQSMRFGPVTLSTEEILEFARRHDPQWFHTDLERAAGPPWHGLIASGFQTCTIAMNLVALNVLAGSESIVSPGMDYLKWPNPVRPGDSLTVTVDVLDVRRSRSKSHLGVVKWRWRMHNQHEVEVLDLALSTLYDLTGQDG
ncbi:MaoC family dehydratase [soil metagenome]